MDNQIICHNCSSIVPPGSLFCPSCGTRITRLKVPADTTAANTATMRLIPDTGSVYLPEGTMLQGKYRINRVLGQGGFGITYDGTDLKLQMHIAIKEYFPSQMASRTSSWTKEVTCSSATSAMYEQGLQNFLKEARNMAKFAGQDNFVSVHDFFIENNTAYIIMEFVDGRNLRDSMKRHGIYSIQSAMTIITPVLDALEKIHAEGMIHRDISPSNIMLLPDGKVKLLDFGAVREISQETQTLTTMSAVYKKGYSPIEQQTVDMRQGTYTDIYALCATLYEMLTGSVPPSPFSRMSGDEQLKPPSSLGVAISPTQEKTLLKGLEVYGKDRIQTVDQLREGLTSQAGSGSRAGKKSGSRTGLSGYGSPSSHKSGEKIPFFPVFTAAAVIAGIIIILSVVRLFARNDPQSSSPPESANTSEAGNKNDPGSPTDSIVSADSNESGESEDSTDSDNSNESRDSTDSDNSNESGDSTDSDNSNESGDSTDSEGSTDSDESNKSEDSTDSNESAELTEDSSPEPEYPSDAVSYNGHHYYIYADDAGSWEKAMLNCKNRGGYLAVINDSDENEFLYKYVLEEGRDQAYFGLTYQGDDWEYLDGDSSDFRDWGYNSKNEKQPNNADEEMYHVSLDTHMHDGHWSDNEFGRQTYRSDGHHYKDICTYICEWDY